MVVGVIEAAVLGYGVHRWRKHKQHKREREALAAHAQPEIYAHVADLPPPSYSTAVLTPAAASVPKLQNKASFLAAPTSTLEKKSSFMSTSSFTETDDGVPKTLTATNLKLLEEGREFRPVYMLERSTSTGHFNRIRTHRALFVGELTGTVGEGLGRAHEIRKDKSSSFFGVQVPWGRTMHYTDADQWVGAKSMDRDPVFLGCTDWTDEELNREGHNMVDDYPTYSLNYANCQHFVADLAERIIPRDKMHNEGMDKLQPTFDKLVEEVGSGEYHGHGTAVVNGVADIALGTARQTHKFFHFTRAAMKSLAQLNWRPFEDYHRLLKEQHLRAIAAHEREHRRRGPRYMQGHSTGSSEASSRVNLVPG